MPTMFKPFASDRGSDLGEGRPYWQQRGWQLSAGFVALALLGGAFVVLRGGPAESTESKPDRSPGEIQIEAAPGLRPPGCTTEDSTQEAPLRPPGDITWRELNGAPVPLSKSAGPVNVGGALLWCFAHTPMGAIMAANVIPRQMSGAAWAEATQQQVVKGQGRDIFVAMRSSFTEPTGRYGAASLAGFLLVAYSPDLAIVRLLIRSARMQASTEYTVVFSGGDWKLKPLASGDLNTPVVPVSDLNGFILWKV